MRRTISVSSSSPTPSARIATSAKARAGRVDVPAKITSSIPAPRSDRAEVSPIAQRSASSRLDLPQPLGPTTPVRPGSTRRSTGSTKLLNPESLSRLILTRVPPERARTDRSGPRRLQVRFELRPGCHIIELLAIEEEGRRAVDALVLRRILHALGDLV